MSLIGSAAGALTGNVGLYALAAAVAIGAGAWGYERVQRADSDKALATERSERAQEKAAAFAAAASQAASFRAKEQTWAKSREEIINVAIQKTEAAASAVAAADSAAGRLRDRIAAIAAAGRRAPGDPAAAGPGAAASAPSDLLANVSRRLEEAVRGVGGFAEASNAAGFACERLYDSVSR